MSFNSHKTLEGRKYSVINMKKPRLRESIIYHFTQLIRSRVSFKARYLASMSPHATPLFPPVPSPNCPSRWKHDHQGR